MKHKNGISAEKNHSTASNFKRVYSRCSNLESLDDQLQISRHVVTVAMRFGNENEHIVAETYAKSFGRNVYRVGFFVINQSCPFLGCSSDVKCTIRKKLTDIGVCWRSNVLLPRAYLSVNVWRLFETRQPTSYSWKFISKILVQRLETQLMQKHEQLINRVNLRTMTCVVLSLKLNPCFHCLHMENDTLVKWFQNIIWWKVGIEFNFFSV